jgi:16S rRNA (cytosine967-C5)-methyltransferase
VIEVQRLASEAVAAVEQGRSLTPTLEALWARKPALSGAQRGGIQDLAFGTCRWHGTLQTCLQALLHKPVVHPRLHALLLVALYQLEWTRAPAHAVVDSAVRTCVSIGQPGAKGLVNAVLRNFLRRRSQIVARARLTDEGRFSYPQWWIDAVRQAWPGRWEAILDAGNTHPPMTLRVNAERIVTSQYLAMLQARGISARPLHATAVQLEHPMPVQSVPGFEDGLVSVQDLGAQYAAALLDLRDGQRVLDACAAPGGKTAHILETEPVRLLALDRDAQRLTRVQRNLARLRLKADVRAADAAELGQWWDGERFDRILLDAPCTASGVVRRHPDSKWLRRPEDIGQLAHEQARLLDALWRTLAPGGKLLYVTCSLFPAETHLQVEAFLAGHKEAMRLPLRDFPEPSGQLLPDARHDGFFYALLQARPMSSGEIDAQREIRSKLA